MRSAWAVARLELREWRALPVLAGAVGAVSLLAILLVPTPAVRAFVATLPELAGIGVALAAGSAALTRDVRERRAAFLLARPMSTGAVWSGKFAAALLLPSAAYALCALPLLLWDRTLLGISPRDAASAVVPTVILVGLGQWASLAFTARGFRLLADAVATVALFAIAVTLSVELWSAGASRLDEEVLGAAWAVVLVAAGCAAVVGGRGSVGAAYAAFTRVHWTGLAACASILGGLLLHFTRAAPDLSRVAIQRSSPDGRWFEVYGGMHPLQVVGARTFVVSPGGGHVVPVSRNSFQNLVGRVSFSGDGRWCAWSSIQFRFFGSFEAFAHVTKLGSGEPVRTIPTRPPGAGSFDPLPVPRLSPTGKALLLSYGRPGDIEVHPTDAGGVFWRKDHADGAGFLDDETVWVLARGPRGRAFVTFGRAQGEYRREVTLGGHAVSGLQVAPSGAYGVALTVSGETALVERCDLGDGGCRPLWEGLHVGARPNAPGPAVAELGFLDDGGVLVTARERPTADAPWLLRAFDADGRVRWTIETPGSDNGPQLVGEPYPGAVLVHFRFLAEGGASAPHPLHLVSVADGRTLRTDDDLYPTSYSTEWDPGFRRGRAATFFNRGNGTVVRLDPHSGAREEVPFR